MFIISISRLEPEIQQLRHIDLQTNYFTIVACSYICISVKKNPLVYGYIFSFFLSKIDVTFIFLEDKKTFSRILNYGINKSYSNVENRVLFFL